MNVAIRKDQLFESNFLQYLKNESSVEVKLNAANTNTYRSLKKETLTGRWRRVLTIHFW